MTELTAPAPVPAPVPASASASASARAARPGRVDLGRVVVVAFSCLALLLLAVRLVAGAGRLTGPVEVARWTDELLTAAMYALMAWACLRRGPARATGRAAAAKVVAVVATVLPLFLGLAGPQRGGAPRPSAGAELLVGDVLLAVGLLWSLWALFTLRRSFSVVAQARVLVEGGPYRWIRHPLYTGEIVAVLGMALATGGPLPLVIWGVLVGLQALRAVTEERLLTAELPGYAGYRRRTARLLPGLF